MGKFKSYQQEKRISRAYLASSRFKSAWRDDDSFSFDVTKTKRTDQSNFSTDGLLIALTLSGGDLMDSTQATQALSTLIQVFLTTFISPVAITELLQAIAAKAGAVLPASAKVVLSFLVSSGLLGTGVISLPAIPVLGPQGSQALYTILVWFASMVIHDKALPPAPKKTPA